MNRQDAIKKGEMFYFTGVPCKRGHIAPRRTANSTCEECAKLLWSTMGKYVAKWNTDNKGRKAEWWKKYYIANHESRLVKCREYRLKNPEKGALNQARWNAANTARRNTLTAEYRTGKDKRTPIWLTEDDHWMMEQAYDLAALRTKMLGFPWHVDHVIPLRGRRVSGLHTPLNLQVIPAVENLKKGNKHGDTIAG